MSETAKAEIHNPENLPNQGEGSAPQTNNAGVAGQTVDSVPGQAKKSAGEALEGVQVGFFKKLRDRTRTAESSRDELAARNRELESRLAALESNNQQVRSENAGSQKVTPFDDPDKWAESVRAQATADARAAVNQAQAQQRLEADAVKAGEWLRSRRDVSQDPRFAQEVAVKIETKYAAAADVNPAAAARAAYLDVCEEKGIEPDLGRNKPDPNNHVSPRVSAAGNGGDRGPVSLDQLRAMSPAEQREAVRSGRYKGNVVRF